MKNILFSMLNQKTSASVTIDGVTYSGNNIQINGDTVIVDGKPQSGSLVGPITVTIHDKVDSIEVSSGNVYANDVGEIETGSGDVECNDVSGNIRTGSGDVDCADVSGNIRTGSGDVECENVTGNIYSNRQW